MKQYIIALIMLLCTPFVGVHAQNLEEVWVDIGSKSESFEYTNEFDTNGQLPYVYYTLTLECPMELEIEGYNNLESVLLEMKTETGELALMYEQYYCGPDVIVKTLPAGKYTIWHFDTYGREEILPIYIKGTVSSENLLPGYLPECPIEIGNISGSYCYSDTRECELYGKKICVNYTDSYFYHSFRLLRPMNITISYSGSGYSFIHCYLKDILGTDLVTKYIGRPGNQILQVTDLPAGDYYIKTEIWEHDYRNMTIQMDFTPSGSLPEEQYPDLGPVDNNEVYTDRDGFRSYKFDYDPLNRLTRATYGQSSNLGTVKRFGVPKISYDKHGNITRLKRWGKTNVTTEGLMDDLVLEYNGNQLRKVTDSGTAPTHLGAFNFVNRTNDGRADEYLYDKNGNLIQDFNKKIADIQYNQLNLPQRVIFEDGKQIDYLYDTAGIKRQVTYRNSATAQPHLTIDYCGNVIYENGVLSKILTEEGYITYNGSTPVYHYYIKDHLGNVRVVLNQNGTVEQRNEYYPFGGLFADGTVQGNTTNQRYRYNGKELDREFGIDMYDYEARQMDAAVGRFTTMDPMAEKYYSISPYAYCNNNPMRFVDPDGEDIIDIIKGVAHGLVGHDPNKPTSLQSYTLDTFGAKEYAKQQGDNLERVPSGNSDYEAGYAAGETTMFIAETLLGLTSAGKNIVSGVKKGVETVIKKTGKKSIKDVIPAKSLNNKEAREIYNELLKGIDVNVAFTKENAKKVVKQRNELKKAVRKMMSDEERAKSLDKKEPIQSFEYYYNKYYDQGLRGEELYKEIINKGRTANKNVNSIFGIK